MDRELNLANEKELTALGKALSSETRIKILHVLGNIHLCVNEIAEILDIPAASAALNIRVLEDAGMIRTELKPAARGSMKMCIPQEGKIILDFQRQEERKKIEVISMPVGNYVDYKITPTCGMVNEEGYIDGEDEPRCFYDPKRTTAKLICFPPAIWNIVFQMLPFRARQPESWNFLQNFVQKRLTIIWTTLQISHCGLMEKRRE